MKFIWDKKNLVITSLALSVVLLMASGGSLTGQLIATVVRADSLGLLAVILTIAAVIFYTKDGGNGPLASA